MSREVRIPTFEGRIYVGLTEGYDGPQHTVDEVKDICQAYCDDIGLCVTVTPTTFIYKRGREDGAIVGLINYPRFAQTSDAVRQKAEELAALLQERLGQNRVTTVFIDETVMFEVSEPTVQK